MDTRPLGNLHNKLDVKVLILFIMARIDEPVTGQEIFEVAYQDESLNYFTFAESLPELVDTGHLQVDDRNRYSITEKGREQGAQVEDSLALSVVQKVSVEIEKKNDALRRASSITAQAFQDETGSWIAGLRYRDGDMPIMSLSLMAPNEELARIMAENLRKNAEQIYRTNLDLAEQREASS